MTPGQNWFLRPVLVPLQRRPADQRSAQAAASAIVARNPRSFEVFWDGSEFELCFGSSTEEDLEQMAQLYRLHLKVGLAEGGSGQSMIATLGGNGKYPVPVWLPRLDPSRTRFFHVGNAFGHCFAVFDAKKTGMLMTPLLIAIQRSKYAWVQFEWAEAALQDRLGDLGSTMAARWKTINTPIEKTVVNYDAEGRPHSRILRYDHPAKSGEFNANFGKLRAHIHGKMGSRLAAVIVRGLVNLGREGAGEMPFNMIEDSSQLRQPRDLPFQQVSTAGGESKLGEWLKETWSDDPRMLLDMARRRTFDFRKLLKAYAKDYLPWRHSLPFLILGCDEMGLLVHPPSSDVRGVRTTRRSELPPPPTQRVVKKGIQVSEGTPASRRL